jgi:glucokinase
VIVLAGDIGGTNSRLALYQEATPLFERTYPSANYASLGSAVAMFMDEAVQALGVGVRPERACLGIAGPVAEGRGRVTNLSWEVDAEQVAAHAAIPRVLLVNDFHAAAFGVTLLAPDQLHPLGGGARAPRGPIAVLGPGTGLGEAFLLWSDIERRHLVMPSEGGHADFAPRTALEAGLLAHLASRHDHVSYERVLSGPGLREVFGYLMDEPACHALLREDSRAALAGSDDTAALVVAQATAGDPLCRLAVHLFSSVLGGLAGNLALTVLATGGVFIAGGIAPRLVALLDGGPFREAFEAKGRLRTVVAKVPAFVVMHREVGLIGAAALAERG